MADTDEAIREARRQGYEEGRKAEREYVVAWLNAKASRIKSYTYSDADERTVLERVAEGIEDGDHIVGTKEGGNT